MIPQATFDASAFTPQTVAAPITGILWLIPALPIVASGMIALLKQPKRKAAAALAIGSLSISLLLSLWAFAHVLAGWANHLAVRETCNFTWIQVGAAPVQLGWILDPLAAVMLVMVSFVSLLIFIYSIGYMAQDENFTRFFCFLSLFAGAMLGVVISNSILLLFMCWELVGLTSYLLIGFWYAKPSAAAAAKKAFLTTRVGDVFFFLGIVWLFAQTGTLLFYNYGAGSLEGLALNNLLAATCGLWHHRGRGHRPAHFLRRGGQKRPASAAHLAAGCDGRPHPGVGADSRGDHGGRGRLSDRARVSADVGGHAAYQPPRRDCGDWRPGGGHLGGRADRGVCRPHRHRAERHQAHPRLLHDFAAWLHDGRPGSGRRGRRHVPPDHPRLLQIAALPGRGLGDSRRRTRSRTFATWVGCARACR